ncbi:hypothetical protein AAE02nite_43100 [Adhaeribacter aerolatus]|uniref:Uncharacterized protein n=1 Tax=Adhaeribacter aerolatus TaxID=670289 RepID=A0A512B3V5_9BACT|nr:hypothetical protein [Adhaeribacter aerolatus]GEO06646.1 hypothetical protein AAE02nite_43100 [Adhaeribacter aerolatus]
MIDQYQFKTLPFYNQASYIWAEGTYLATRQEDGHKINLYQLKDFFAEIWYHQSQEHIFKIRTFTSKKCLEAYLDLMVLD